MKDWDSLRPFWQRFWWLSPLVWLLAGPLYLTAGLLAGFGWWLDEGLAIYAGLRAVARRIRERIQEEIEPRLQRAAPTVEQRI